MRTRRAAWLGAAIFTLAVALFAWLAWQVQSRGPITAVDSQLAAWFNRHAFSPLTELMLGYTHLHGTIGVLVMGAILLRVQWRRREWAWASALVVVLPGGMLFNFTLKHLFARLRPLVDDPLLVLHSYSFPSGHTVGATLFYASLATYLLARPAPLASRGMIIGVALALTALTAFSRLYLAVHYLSDVLGAFLLGLAWFGAWTALIMAGWRHYSARPRSN